MRFRFRVTAYALVAGLIYAPLPSLAESLPSSQYKVLSAETTGLNVFTVQSFLDKGDAAISKGNVSQAKIHFDKARVLSKQLLSFYRDLNGAFRGLDARIPREMDREGRKVLSLLANANLRLAALFRRQNEPEVAVPLLVEVIRLMTPTKPEGKQAYQALYELGFVKTPYAASRGL